MSCLSQMFNLVILMIVDLLISCHCQPCSFADGEINCENFNRFKELNFENVNDVVKSIRLRPANSILLDESLQFYNLNFTADYTVRLENIKGFSLISLSNPFPTGGNLYLRDSTFDFYNDGNKVNSETCNEINQKDFHVSFFHVFVSITLEEGVTYPDEICSCEFKNVRIETFVMLNINKTNKLNFIQTPANATELNCTVRDLQISSSEIDLDTSFVNTGVFRHVQSMFVQLSTVNFIDEYFFSRFHRLRIVKLAVNNFKQLFNNSNQTKWLRNLNHQTRVNLEDPNDVSRNRDNQLMIELKDLNNKYDFPEQDFCYYESYPHENLVFPVIETKPNLECTCTLIWLLKNKSLFAKSIELLNTKSVSKCLKNPNFDSIVSECQFNKKKDACANQEKSKWCKTKNELVSTNSFKTLSTVFIILWGFSTVALCFTLYLTLRYKRADSNFSFSFK